MATASNKPVKISANQKEFHGNYNDFELFKGLLEKKGVSGWNRWRRYKEDEHTDTFPNLHGINLSNLNLRGIDLGGAGLRKACLNGTKLHNAILNEARLEGAELEGTWFNGAQLVRTDLYEVIATGARFVDANLTSANLDNAQLQHARFIGCKISGATLISARIDETTIQKQLRVIPDVDASIERVDVTGSIVDLRTIVTDSMESAVFINLISNSRKFRLVIDAMSKNVVLLLGNFSRQRKSVLTQAAEKLKSLGYIPVIYDFESNRDIMDTVAFLAGISCFVIADLTKPHSTPLESLLVTSGMMTPFAPIIKQGHEVFSMFHSLRAKYFWVLEPVEYTDAKHLSGIIKTKVVNPCKKMKAQIDKRRDEIEEARMQEEAKLKKHHKKK